MVYRISKQKEIVWLDIPSSHSSNSNLFGG